MTDIVYPSRLIPPNPSDINFERDFRTNAETLLTGIKLFDGEFTLAVNSMGKDTFEEGINVIKTTSISNKNQIIESLEATNLSSDTSLLNNKTWSWGVDSGDVAENLRFSTLHERFQYVDSILDESKGSNSSINLRFELLETNQSLYTDEIDQAHDPKYIDDTLKKRFERSEGSIESILSDDLTYSNISGKLIESVFFVYNTPTVPNGGVFDSRYHLVFEIADHGIQSGDEIYLRIKPGSTQGPLTLNGYVNSKYYLEKVNNSTRFFRLRRYLDSQTDRSTDDYKYLTAADIGFDISNMTAVDGSQSGNANFSTTFLGTYASLYYKINELITDLGLETETVVYPEYEILNIFDTPSERFEAIEQRASTFEISLQDISGLLTNAITLDTSEASDASYLTIEGRFSSVEGRTSIIEDEITAAHRNESDNLDTRFSEIEVEIDATHRTETDTLDDRFSDSEALLLSARSEELANSTSTEAFQSIQSRFSTVEARASSLETEVTAARSLEVDLAARLNTFALKNGSNDLDFSAANLSVANGMDLIGGMNLNNSKIENLATPTELTDGVNKEYVDNNLLSRDQQISNLLLRTEVPAYSVSGTDEGKVLQISGNSATWQTPAQVDTSTAYSWIPDVAFQTVQIDGEVLLDRVLDAGFTYVVEGDLYIASNATLTVPGSDIGSPAVLIITGTLRGEIDNLIIGTGYTYNPKVYIENWQWSKRNFVISGNLSTGDFNLTGYNEWECSLELEQESSFTINDGNELVFKNLVYSFNVGGEKAYYTSTADIPAIFLPLIGTITVENGGSIEFIDKSQELRELQDAKTLASYFTITENATERIFQLNG